MSKPTLPPTDTPVVIDYASTPTVPLRQRIWTADTLVYTFGGLVGLFFWLLWGDFALYLKERSGPPMLQVLLKHFNASDLLLALLVTSLPQCLALIVGPIVSYKSDRHRGRFGRRIPFLIATVPIAVFAMIGLAFTPALGKAAAPMLGASTDRAILLFFGIFWAIFEIASIVVANVVFPGLIADVVPKPVLGRFFGLFRIGSLGAGMIFLYYFMGRVEAHYTAIFLGFGALYGIAFTLMCFNVKEGVAPHYASPLETAQAADAIASASAGPDNVSNAPAIADAESGAAEVATLQYGRARQSRNAIVTYFRDTFSKPYYLWFFASFALAQMAFTPINTFSVPYALSLGMSMTTYGKLSALQLALSLAQAYPIGWLADRFHPLRITMVSMLLYGATTLVAFFVVRNTFMFGIAHVICGTCAGFWITATAPLGAALLPRSRFTQFLSANHLCVATGTMLIAPICGKFLDLTGHHYQYIYLFGFILIVASMVVTLELYRQFKQRGGQVHYVAPE